MNLKIDKNGYIVEVYRLNDGSILKAIYKGLRKNDKFISSYDYYINEIKISLTQFLLLLKNTT